MIFRSLKEITAPATEPVSLAEFRLYIKADSNFTTDDTLYTALIKSARLMIEKYCARALVTQTWEMRLDNQPCRIQLYKFKGYIQSVTSVNVLAEDGTESLQSTSLYQTIVGDNGIIFLRTGAIWGITTRPEEKMVIKFVCGYGNAAAVPEDIKTAIKQLAAAMSEDRELLQIPETIRSLLTAYRVVGL